MAPGATSRSVLKGYFNTGDTPTEAQFSELIDKVPNITDDYNDIIEKFYSQEIVVSGSEQNITIVDADATSYFVMTDAVIITKSMTGTPAGGQVDIYYNSADQNVFGTGATPFLGTGFFYRSANVFNGTVNLFSGDYDMIVKCPALPAGVTACTIKVIVKGFKISK